MYPIAIPFQFPNPYKLNRHLHRNTLMENVALDDKILNLPSINASTLLPRDRPTEKGNA